MNQWQNQNTHFHLANAHRQQANYHQQQAQLHHEQANAHARSHNWAVQRTQTGYTGGNTWQAGTTGQTLPNSQTANMNQQNLYTNQSVQSQWNNPRYTASNNQVSPAALVFHGQISPEAIRSIQEYQNPYNQQRGSQQFTSPMSHHAQHATDNATSVYRTIGQYFNT